MTRLALDPAAAGRGIGRVFEYNCPMPLARCCTGVQRWRLLLMRGLEKESSRFSPERTESAKIMQVIVQVRHRVCRLAAGSPKHCVV